MSEIISSLDAGAAYPGAIEDPMQVLDQEWQGAGATDRPAAGPGNTGDVYNYGRASAAPNDAAPGRPWSDGYPEDGGCPEDGRRPWVGRRPEDGRRPWVGAGRPWAAEANDEDIDGDEAGTYQARSRNDSVRATAGTMRRSRDMDKYLREEVAEAEPRYWWGRHEQ